MTRRRLAVRVFAVATGLFLAAFLLSLPWSFVFQGTSQTLILGNGRLCWFTVGSRDSSPVAPTTPTGVYPNSSWLPEVGLDVFVSRPARFPATIYIELPLWLPFVLVATPAVLLWWIKRRPAPGRCTGCGYNLTGNVSGVCPECGKSVASG